MKLPSIALPGTAGIGQLIRPAMGLLLVVLAAIPLSGAAMAQPRMAPGDEITLVNVDREFVERKKEGEFIARPVFNLEIDALYYAIRDADTGDWLTGLYRVIGGEKKLSEGWEYSWEYPVLSEQPKLDPDRAYLLVLVAGVEDVGTEGFHAVVPIHEPTRIWDRILSALSPGRWAKALAVWTIEGTHGTICGVVERASGEDADECRREYGG